MDSRAKAKTGRKVDVGRKVEAERKAKTALKATTDPKSEPGSPPECEVMSIAEACEQTGLSARTIRYYEELDLLPGVRRRAGGRRVYGPDEVERLRFIQRLKAFGLSLAEVKELNAVYAIGGSTRAMLQRLDEHLGSHLLELDARIGEHMRLRDEMSKYRDHVEARIQGLASARSGASLQNDSGEGETS
jgi:DNA-binding transcriptional MerR regulator